MKKKKILRNASEIFIIHKPVATLQKHSISLFSFLKSRRQSQKGKNLFLYIQFCCIFLLTLEIRSIKNPNKIFCKIKSQQDKTAIYLSVSEMPNINKKKKSQMMTKNNQIMSAYVFGLA